MTELVMDNWDGTRNDETVLQSPSWDAISKAIHGLDGRVRTLVTITRDDSSHMAIGGGGQNGLYVVYATHDGVHFQTATRRNGANTKVVVVAGGQEGEFPERRCVDLDTALSAAKAFAETGRLDPQIHWED
jgi:hypothetical protein